MLATERQQGIVELVRQHGSVRVAELVERFGVSDMTIRRDLEALADRKLLVKVHGGATSIEEPGFSAKSMVQQDEKDAIGARAATFVEPGSAIAISAGTTTWTVARHLLSVPRLTVVTNSLQVADTFHDKDGRTRRS